ncbi:MAG: pseudouridine synthase [Parcubacteria group bacterium]|nr:MAG: pseudouridine synthase [Parcubacteria group bacterium]
MGRNRREIRLASFLAKCGVASRRKSEVIIESGRVKIAGGVVTDVATNVSPDATDVSLDNKLLQPDFKVYYLLNKPRGYVCTVTDRYNPQTVLSLVPKLPKVFPVGRLDKESQGLLLLTNDGDLAFKLTHPKFEIKKTYIVRIDRPFTEEMAGQLLKGMKFNEGWARADAVENKGNGYIQIVLHQGFKRQIRRMLDELGCNVLTLIRQSEGKLDLGNLPLGQYRILSKEEIK